ncbi:unnamed protein product [Amoebophrya sp. A120]|nr:unnamed protein product [Amoebophrya sp. A120]|eukprot:GSA120T00010579001.1
MAPAAPSNYAGDQQPLPEKLREILGEHCQVQRVNKDRKIVGAASPEELGQSMENEQRRKFCENQLSQLGNDFDKVVQWVEAVKAKANALYYSSRYEPDRVQEHELVSDPASDEQAIALCSARPDGTTSPAACPSTSTSCASEDLSCDLAKLKEAALLYYDCLSGLEKCAKIIVAKGQYDEGSSSCSSTTETGGRTENEKTRNSYQQQIQLPITANLAACMLEMRHFRECIRLCDLALSVQPDHVKALVRRGIAYYKLREPGKAKISFAASSCWISWMPPQLGTLLGPAVPRRQPALQLCQRQRQRIFADGQLCI